MSTYLSLRWTTSRGRDTYGYNVVTLTDEATGKRYRAMGGGYDMVGTVFGQWLEDNRASELIVWATRQGIETTGSPWRNPVTDRYGAFVSIDDAGMMRVTLDGACGLDCMTRIARDLGIELERTFKRTGANRGETTGWIVK